MRRLLAVGLLMLWLADPALADVAPELVAPADGPPDLADDGDKESLLAAVARSRAYLAATPRKQLLVAGKPYPVELLRQGLATFETLVTDSFGTPAFEPAVREAFVWAPLSGRDGAGTLLVTGYHLPTVEAREMPEGVFRFPIYGPPTDMLAIDLGAFRPALGGQTAVARIKNGRVVPYHTRREIEGGNALVGKGLEIAWVATDAARKHLMLQGSGMLRYPDGHTANLNYAAQNGHIWSAGEANQSWVFFRIAPDGPYGCDGVPLTAGRAIASDKRLTATGALGFLRYPRARFNEQGGVAAFEPGGRFVLDQDTGGAISGPGRIDVYWGGGDEAARRATALHGAGQIWYLIPRAPLTQVPAARS